MDNRGIELGELTWLSARERLNSDTIIVLPLGAASKEHGPHLRLDNDLTIAEYLKVRVLKECEVVMLHTLGYHFYPAFEDYPGSISLRFETARDLIVDICTSIAKFGPWRFYVINTGVSTADPLAAAAEVLLAQGVVLKYTDITRKDAELAKLVEQEGGTHADEVETSMMLYMAPDRVDMRKAADDFDATGEGPLSPERKPGTTYSPTGIYGNATLATRDKGAAFVEARVKQIIQDISDLRDVKKP